VDIPFGGYEKADLVGDLKLSGNSLYTQYVAGDKSSTGGTAFGMLPLRNISRFCDFYSGLVLIFD